MGIFLSAVPASVIALVVFAVLIVVFYIVLVAVSYKKCPPDKIMVIYGKVGKNPDGTARSFKCIHGGAVLVWPIFQAYSFLDLAPMKILVELPGAPMRKNIRADVSIDFKTGISTECGVMERAAECLRGLSRDDIEELAKDILEGQLRLAVAQTDVENHPDSSLDARDNFLTELSDAVETELKKVGLKLFSANIKNFRVRGEV